jgi:hypothetical protein
MEYDLSEYSMLRIDTTKIDLLKWWDSVLDQYKHYHDLRLIWTGTEWIDGEVSWRAQTELTGCAQ